MFSCSWFALFSIPVLTYLTWSYNYKQKKKILISIEGNIGVGKSSMMDLIKERFLDAEFIYEPVDEWMTIVDRNGKNLLQTFYDDKKRWSYTFQNIAYITRMNHIIDKIVNSKKQYIIIDRSLQADLNTFAKMLYDDGCLNDIEMDAYSRWNNFFEKFYGDKVEHKIIYLRCEPDIAFQRIQIRNREAEKNISPEYIKRLHKYHDDWLANKDNVLLLDVNRDFVKNKQRFTKLYKHIVGFL